MNNAQWKEEQSKLNEVLTEIRKQQARMKSIYDSVKKEAVSLQKSFRENYNVPTSFVGVDFDKLVDYNQDDRLISRMETIYDTTRQTMERLDRMLYSPYFARMDFTEEGMERESVYIGISTLINEETGDIEVYDWRAPISGMYYDFEPGPAYYMAPIGKISGTIHLKRQYKIEKGILRYMFDSSVNINDEFLQEIMAQNTDEKMRNIVSTIQRDQNKAIRDENHRLLIVQGPAGSGKTSVALHRAAWMLYRHKEDLRAEHIIIFSPNNLFNDYISDVLPGLGEENTLRTTIHSFMAGALKKLGRFSIEDMAEQMEWLLTNRNDPGYKARVSGIRLKMSVDFLHILKKYGEYLSGSYELGGKKISLPFLDVTYQGRLIITQHELEQLFYDRLSGLPVMERLQVMRNRVWEFVEPYKKGRLKQIKDELLQNDEYSYMTETEINNKASVAFQKEMDKIREEMDNWWIYPGIKDYRRLFEDSDLLHELAKAVGCNLPDNLEEIRMETLARLDQNRIGYEDAAAIIYLKVIIGAVVDYEHIRHVIVDEAQDYSPLHLDILRRVFPKAEFTVLGDLNQSINPCTYSDNYEDMKQLFGQEQTSQITLVKSYRSTKEILDFASAILPQPQLVEAVRANGTPPVIRITDPENHASELAKGIKLLQEKGAGSIAIIGRSSKFCGECYDALKELIDGVRLIKREDSVFHTGIIVIPSYLSKGLEFDAVLIADGESYINEDERKLLYTACTRALHYLEIYCCGQPSPLLQQSLPYCRLETLDGNSGR